MARLFYHVMQDNLGNLLFDVTGTMRLAGTGTAATIYGDEALTIPIANPMTNHPSFGSFKCFLGAGDYDFYMAKAGYTFETLTGVQGHGSMAQQDASAVAITGGSITGLSALTATGAARMDGTFGVNSTVPAPYAAAFNDRIYVATMVTIATQLQAYTLFCNGSAGTPGGVWVNSTSSAALKDAIRPLHGASEVVKRLLPRLWNWRRECPDLEAQMPGTQAGFVMEEVAAVHPAWAPVAEDGTPGLAMRGLEAYVVATLQEVLARLDALEARTGA